MSRENRDDSQSKAKKAEEAFIRGLIERGEAAKADEHGKLPAGVTHEIIGISESGLGISESGAAFIKPNSA